MGKTPGGGGWPYGGREGILRGGGGSVMGGMGRPAGGITGGGGKGIMPGRLTSSTMSGSLPWSNGQRSPRTQNPFSVKGRERHRVRVKHLQSQVFTSGTTVSLHYVVFDSWKQMCLTKVLYGCKTRRLIKLATSVAIS